MGMGDLSHSLEAGAYVSSWLGEGGRGIARSWGSYWQEGVMSALCGSGDEADQASADQCCWAAVGSLSGASHVGQAVGLSMSTAAAELRVPACNSPPTSTPPPAPPHPPPSPAPTGETLLEMLGQTVQTVAQ